MARSEAKSLGEKRHRLLAELSGDVLEIGAGTGANFAHYPPAARVTALEPDPYMARRAEARLLPNITLQLAPAEHLPFPDDSFDVVVSTLVLCTVNDVPASLTEIRRVLRPGGTLRFMEHVRPSGVAGRIVDAVQPVYGWISAGCHANRRTEQALLDARFEIVQIQRFRFNGAPGIAGVARPVG
jgi:ubiquinone/menaquinone biosynthesis C-methylase UbiE